MRIGKKVVKQQATTETVSHACDLCSGPMPVDGVYKRYECRLHFAEGDLYPEGDGRDHFNLDVCPECFHGKLRPLLKEKLGVDFRTSFGEDPYYDSYAEVER